jgi:hypothetical protein
MVCIDFNSIKLVGITAVALSLVATLEKTQFNL